MFEINIYKRLENKHETMSFFVFLYFYFIFYIIIMYVYICIFFQFFCFVFVQLSCLSPHFAVRKIIKIQRKKYSVKCAAEKNR